jgi:hypothetical protein
MEQAECSETSVHKIQTPCYHLKERIQQLSSCPNLSVLSSPVAFTTIGQQQPPLLMHTSPVDRIAAVVLL